jgi:hypothetical protein
MLTPKEEDACLDDEPGVPPCWFSFNFPEPNAALPKGRDAPGVRALRSTQPNLAPKVVTMQRLLTPSLEWLCEASSAAVCAPGNDLVVDGFA